MRSAPAAPSVRNRPAVALCLDFARVDRERPENYWNFFGEALPDELLRPQPITPAQCDYFRDMIDPSFAAVPLGDGEGLFGSASSVPAYQMA